MKKAILFSIVGSFVLGNAFAGSQENLSQSKPLSFEELRESCTNPERFHNQIPPKDIKITCEDYRTVWMPLEQKSFEMKSKRDVKTSLISDKYHVTDVSAQVPHQSATGSCPIFQEMNQSLKTQKKVTCEELVAHQGNLLDLCLRDIDKTIADNADVVDQKATGRIFTTCKGQIVQEQQAVDSKGFGMEQQDEQGMAQGKDEQAPVKEPVKEEQSLGQDQGKEELNQDQGKQEMVQDQGKEEMGQDQGKEEFNQEQGKEEVADKEPIQEQGKLTQNQQLQDDHTQKD